MRWKELARSVKHWLLDRKISYSQTGEDLIAGFYLSGLKKGFYVDIGANDPMHLNNTYFFYKRGWRGICVEPDAEKVNLIKLRRPKDTVIQAGVGDRPGVMPFYVFDPDTVSTFSSVEKQKYQNLGYTFIGEQQVKIQTLEQIFRENLNGQHIDILSIDTEGQDFEVLKSNDWQKFRPTLVIVEVIEHCGNFGLRQARRFDEFMSSKDYVKFADTNINALYLEKSFAEAKKITSIANS